MTVDGSCMPGSPSSATTGDTRTSANSAAATVFIGPPSARRGRAILWRGRCHVRERGFASGGEGFADQLRRGDDLGCGVWNSLRVQTCNGRGDPDGGNDLALRVADGRREAAQVFDVLGIVERESLDANAAAHAAKRHQRGDRIAGVGAQRRPSKQAPERLAVEVGKQRLAVRRAMERCELARLPGNGDHLAGRNVMVDKEDLATLAYREMRRLPQLRC